MANLKPVQQNKITATKRSALLVAGIFIISTSAGFVGGWLGATNKIQGNGFPRDNAKQVFISESQIISGIAEEVGESVVSISVSSQSTISDFFGFRRPVTRQSAGTGFILSEEGVVITNRHVIPAGIDSVSVTLSDGTEFEDVEVIGRTNSADPLDVAFLKINDNKGKKLKPVELGNSSDVNVGSRVVAIGNALGQFQNTVTAGIISGYGRSVQAFDEGGTDTLQNLFQTDAAINQGNSGGPLVDVNGKVIGINTAVAGGGAENIGFAIPIDDVKGLINSVLESGKLLRPYLGVRYIQLTDDLAVELGLETKRGAYIVESKQGQPAILPGSPAEKAGLKEKDVITRVEDHQIGEKNSLVSLVGRHRVGDIIKLTVVRAGEELVIDVTLDAAPNE